MSEVEEFNIVDPSTYNNSCNQDLKNIHRRYYDLYSSLNTNSIVQPKELLECYIGLQNQINTIKEIKEPDNVYIKSKKLYRKTLELLEKQITEKNPFNVQPESSALLEFKKKAKNLLELNYVLYQAEKSFVMPNVTKGNIPGFCHRTKLPSEVLISLNSELKLKLEDEQCKTGSFWDFKNDTYINNKAVPVLKAKQKELMKDFQLEEENCQKFYDDLRTKEFQTIDICDQLVAMLEGDIKKLEEKEALEKHTIPSTILDRIQRPEKQPIGGQPINDTKKVQGIQATLKTKEDELTTQEEALKAAQLEGNSEEITDLKEKEQELQATLKTKEEELKAKEDELTTQKDEFERQFNVKKQEFDNSIKDIKTAVNIEPTANKDEEMQKNLITAGIVTLCVAILSISIIGISGGFAMPLFAGIIGIVIAPIIALMSVYGINMETSQTLNVSTIHNGNEIASNTLELKSNSREKQTLIDFNIKGIVANNLNDVHQQNRNV